MVLKKVFSSEKKDKYRLLIQGSLVEVGSTLLDRAQRSANHRGLREVSKAGAFDTPLPVLKDNLLSLV